MTERAAAPRWALVTLCGLALALLALLRGGVRLAPPATAPAPTPTVTGGITYAQLEASPEAHLFVPDATPLRDFGGDATGPTLLHPRGQTAFAAHEVGTRRVASDVLAFYTAALPALGYGPPIASGGASGQGPSTSWRKGTLIFRYAPITNPDLDGIGAARAAPFATVYAISLLVDGAAPPTATAGATP